MKSTYHIGLLIAAIPTIAALILCSLASLATAQGMQEVPCAETRFVINIDNPKCRQIHLERVAEGNKEPPIRQAVNGEYEKGPYVIVALMPFAVNATSGFFQRTSKDTVVEKAKNFSPLTKEATRWSEVRSMGSTWLMTFESQGRRCLFAENYGAEKNGNAAKKAISGYTWITDGISCDGNTQNAGKEYSEHEIETILSLVVPK